MPLPAISPGFVQMLAARSGWFSWTPESMTATTTLGLPVVVFQAALASMSTSLFWSRPHSCGSPGSFGVKSAEMTRSGSAYATPGIFSSWAMASLTGRLVSMSSRPGTRLNDSRS